VASDRPLPHRRRSIARDPLPRDQGPVRCVAFDALQRIFTGKLLWRECVARLEMGKPP